MRSLSIPTIWASQKVNVEATGTITFSVAAGAPWAQKSDEQLAGEWKAAAITATPLSDPAAVPPDQITITASGTYNGKPASKNITLNFEGPPSITFDPDAVILFPNPGKRVEVKYKMNGGSLPIPNGRLLMPPTGY